DERGERASLDHDRHTLPRLMRARTFGEVRLRDDVLRAVPLETAVHRMLAAENEAPAWPQVAGNQRHRRRQVRRPSEAVDGEHEIEVIRRHSRIDFHRRLDQANARRTLAQRLFRERDLYWGKIDAPQFTSAALGEVPQRVPAAASELERT